MAEYLIVDGYNILHQWNSLKKLLSEDLEHARIKLVDMLSNYQAVKGIKVIVVFDAHLVKGGVGSVESVNGVEVIYTTEGETADMLIEKLVGRLEAYDLITVATSDWAEQRIVFGKGAIRFSARELEEEITDHSKETKQYFNAAGSNRDLRGRLKEDIREILEKIRRQK